MICILVHFYGKHFCHWFLNFVTHFCVSPLVSMREGMVRTNIIHSFMDWTSWIYRYQKGESLNSVDLETPYSSPKRLENHGVVGGIVSIRFYLGNRSLRPL